MSEYMLCAKMALNGFTAMGVKQDWATHRIGHEITALKGVTHGQTLVIVLPALMNVMREQKGDKIIQYGHRIFNIQDGDKKSLIDQTIIATTAFFESLGLSTRLRDVGVGDDAIDEIVGRFMERGTVLGDEYNIDADKIREILTNCK